MPLKQKTEPWDCFLNQPDGPRPPINTRAFAGKRILITGAGGYIGSALTRALSNVNTGQLILLDNSEHGLYALDLESPCSKKRTIIVGSVLDQVLIDEVFNRHSPHIVFHAAALKHVPLMESNPFAAVETNVFGTHTLAGRAARHGVERFVLVSTDKAVDPISIMGATKRIAELIILAVVANTTMHALRLCNVLGSSGSVAPLFCQQVAAGEQITVTHPDATRFFLSIDDTIRCLLAATLSPQSSGLLIPEVGPAYRIEDLAHLLNATAPGPHPRHPIVFTGLRPGDKLHEHMTSSRETITAQTAENLLAHVNSPTLDSGALAMILRSLQSAIKSRHLPDLLQAIEEAVPEYSISESLRTAARTNPEEAREQA